MLWVSYKTKDSETFQSILKIHRIKDPKTVLLYSGNRKVVPLLKKGGALKRGTRIYLPSSKELVYVFEGVKGFTVMDKRQYGVYIGNVNAALDRTRDFVRLNLLEAGRASIQPLCMTKRSPFRYFKTSPEVIRLAVMMYVRFPLSLRNVEDLLHERGIDISHETVRFWWNRFGPIFAAEIRRKRVQQLRAYSNWQWHLDKVFVKINGETHYLRRAVDHEGEVLESYVTKRRDRKAALKFLRKIMKRYGKPHVIVTDKLRSYGAALKVIGNAERQETGRWLNNRGENSHQPFRRRERAMQRFRRMRSLQKFVSIHASVFNHFNQERSLSKRDYYQLNRTAALAEWRSLCAA